MKVLTATMKVEKGNQTETLDVPREQIEKDMPKIKKVHNEMMQKDMTWPFFGGIVSIENRKYQVSP